MTETEEQLNTILDLYSLKNLVHEPTCYKSQTEKCINLVLKNRSKSVQQTTTVETGLSDSHKMVVKTTFPKHRPTVINCRNYKTLTKLFLKLNCRTNKEK